MTTDEKRAEIREYSLQINKIHEPVGLINGLMLLPNLKKEVKETIEKAGYKGMNQDFTIYIEDPREAYRDALLSFLRILLWFQEHPSIDLKIDDQSIEAAKSLEVVIENLTKDEDDFVQAYKEGSFPMSLITLGEALKLLTEIEVGFETLIRDLVFSLPFEEQRAAAMEYQQLAHGYQFSEEEENVQEEENFLNKPKIFN